MCTGVRSSVVLDGPPASAVWEAFVANPQRAVTVTDMDNGRVHVACFDSVAGDHLDLLQALREASGVLRNDFDSLRG